MTQIQYLDKIEVLQEMDIAAAPTLKSHNAETSGAPSCLWVEGEGFMGKFEREMRAKMMPADATDVVFISSFLDDKCSEVLRSLSENGTCVSVFSTEIEDADFCEVWHIRKKMLR